MEKNLKIEKEYYSFLGTYVKYSLYNEDDILCSTLYVELESDRKKEKRLCEYKNEKICLITCFETLCEFRGKGYGRYLLSSVLNDLNGKCDIVHLDACPYYRTSQHGVVCRAYGNALSKNKLVEFYKSFGFTTYSKFKTDGYNCYVMLLHTKKG